MMDVFLFHGASSSFRDLGACATACLCVRLGFVSQMNHSFETFWWGRLETNEITVERLEEFTLFFFRTLHVNNVDRVVVAF